MDRNLLKDILENSDLNHEPKSATEGARELLQTHEMEQKPPAIKSIYNNEWSKARVGLKRRRNRELTNTEGKLEEYGLTIPQNGSTLQITMDVNTVGSIPGEREPLLAIQVTHKPDRRRIKKISNEICINRPMNIRTQRQLQADSTIIVQNLLGNKYICHRVGIKGKLPDQTGVELNRNERLAISKLWLSNEN